MEKTHKKTHKHIKLTLSSGIGGFEWLGNGKRLKERRIEGTLTEARKLLALHEADHAKQVAQKPTKATLKMAFDNWNAMVGDVRSEETTQTSTRNLQRHMLEYFGDIRIDKLTTTLIRKYLAYLLLSVKLDAPAPCRLDVPDLDFACRAPADCLYQHLQVI